MENETGSKHLKPHILPPLGAPRISNEPGKIINSPNIDKPLRQRIGTPAPQKKSPIPDDLDLDNLNVKRGNPAIKVESCKLDDIPKKYHIIPEKTMRTLPEDVPGTGNNNLNCRLPKKPQLQPIMNPIFNVKDQGDLNGNDIIRRYDVNTSDIPPAGKIQLPNKYTPLKPIARKKSDFD